LVYIWREVKALRVTKFAVFWVCRVTKVKNQLSGRPQNINNLLMLILDANYLIFSDLFRHISDRAVVLIQTVDVNIKKMLYISEKYHNTH